MRKLTGRLVSGGLWLLVATLVWLLAIEIWQYVGFAPVVCAQENPAEGTKTLVLDRLYRTDPIEVLKVLGGGKEAKVCDCRTEVSKWALIWDGGHYPARGPAVGAARYQLQSDDNWLSTLSFVLKNRTSKRIFLVAITIILPFPAPGPPFVKCSRRFPFGELPAILADTRAGDRLPASTKNPIRFDPGHEMTFALAQRKTDLYYLIKQAQPLSEASLCRVQIRVVFEDGLQWHLGDYYQTDPEHPGESMVMAEDYFPGPLTGPPPP